MQYDNNSASEYILQNDHTVELYPVLHSFKRI